MINARFDHFIIFKNSLSFIIFIPSFLAFSNLVPGALPAIKFRKHPIEVTGEKLRSMMPWIKTNKIVDKSKN